MRTNTGRAVFFLLFILLLGAGAAYIDWPTTPGIHIGGYNNTLAVRQGLDLTGGIQFTLVAQCPTAKPNCDRASAMPAVIDAVNKRVSGGLGVNDAVVRQEQNFQILVQIPGKQDEAQAQALLGQTGLMEIIDTSGSQLAPGTVVTPGQYPIVLTGADLDPNAISAQIDSQTNQPVVTFAFQGAAKSKFAAYTRDHIQQFLTITLDGKVIESATIQSEIDGQGQITGIGNITDAQNLATQLKYGALPLPLKFEATQVLSATLGQQSILYSIRAALIGLSMVVLFMLIFYRLPGLLADVALVFYALFLFAVIKILGVTLSLPGIAALVLTIGMAVDANILIFERVKEELRSGRTMASAIDVGFKRAWPSIRDSNASTLITAGILYWFGNNFGAEIIVGFATNLAIGVLISLFTAVVVTRNFLSLLIFSGVAMHPELYGLPVSAVNVARYRPTQRVAPKPARPLVVATRSVADDADDDLDDTADDDEFDAAPVMDDEGADDAELAPTASEEADVADVADAAPPDESTLAAPAGRTGRTARVGALNGRARNGVKPDARTTNIATTRGRETPQTADDSDEAEE